MTIQISGKISRNHSKLQRAGNSTCIFKVLTKANINLGNVEMPVLYRRNSISGKEYIMLKKR